MSNTKSIQHEEVIRNTLLNKELPRVYFNGFIVSASVGDVIIILQQQGEAVAILNASHIIAKTLSVKLGDVIKGYEEVTSENFKTTDEINDLLSRREENINDNH